MADLPLVRVGCDYDGELHHHLEVRCLRDGCVPEGLGNGVILSVGYSSGQTATCVREEGTDCWQIVSREDRLRADGEECHNSMFGIGACVEVECGCVEAKVYESGMPSGREHGSPKV